MSAPRNDDAPVRPRPRPAATRPTTVVDTHRAPHAARRATGSGNAVLVAARASRLVGRLSWRIARQLPGVDVVEAQARQIGRLAATEFAAMLQFSALPGAAAVIGVRSHHIDDHATTVTLVEPTPADPQPLRTAMTELLDRSITSDGSQSRDYLFATIVHQLVPDEARVLAALATGRTYAAVDVTSKSGQRTTLVNASTVGAAAGVAVPDNTGTYLTRLHALGLVEFGTRTDQLSAQFESLRSDPQVRAARTEADGSKQGSSKITRKAVRLSPLGREFWRACAPATPGSATEMRR